MFSVISASRYHPRYQSTSSMYIRDLIPRNFAELAEAVPIGTACIPYYLDVDPHDKTLYCWQPIEHSSRTLIRLCGCRSGAFMGANASLNILLHASPV